uniref:Uncharacterized protein n=1 Tax=Trichogramma kaykai TaxID=54128 RepID=A0ABD2XMS8_9HYME
MKNWRNAKTRLEEKCERVEFEETRTDGVRVVIVGLVQVACRESREREVNCTLAGTDAAHAESRGAR